jgi:hypothetical protein
MKTILLSIIPYFPSILQTTSVETLPGSLVCLLGQPAIFFIDLAVCDLIAWSQESIVFFSGSEVTEAIQQSSNGKQKKTIKFHGGEAFVKSYFSTVTREMPSIL